MVTVVIRLALRVLRAPEKAVAAFSVTGESLYLHGGRSSQRPSERLREAQDSDTVVVVEPERRSLRIQ